MAGGRQCSGSPGNGRDAIHAANGDVMHTGAQVGVLTKTYGRPRCGRMLLKQPRGQSRYSNQPGRVPIQLGRGNSQLIGE
ncbi:hypothetical protein M433DRAFT_213916 [Acidomyces richmondensis BFW]|nr:hypothetical protein M433DRAFT_213916 [Acidomyces richmondensis BFW]